MLTVPLKIYFKNNKMSRNRLIIGKEMGQVGKTMSQYIGNVANVNLYTGFFKPDLLKVSQKHFPKANFSRDWLSN